MEVTSTITNAEDFIEVLRRSMPKAMGDGVVGGALLKAARPMVGELKSLYRSLGASGALAAATKAWRVGPRSRKYGALVRVGPLRYNSLAIAKYAAYYGRVADGIRHGHLVERGTKLRRTKTGVARGQVEGKWYVKRAANATIAQCGRIFQQTLAKDMDRAMSRRAQRKSRA